MLKGSAHSAGVSGGTYHEWPEAIRWDSRGTLVTWAGGLHSGGKVRHAFSVTHHPMVRLARTCPGLGGDAPHFLHPWAKEVLNSLSIS